MVDPVVEAFLRRELRSDHSRRGYRDDWRKFCEWLRAREVEPLAATATDVHRYMRALEGLGKGPAVRRRALAVIRSIYGALVVAGDVFVNPAREVRSGK